MNEPNITDVVTAVAAVLSFFVTFAAVVVASKQLGGLRKEAKRNNFLMLLALEAELNNRKVRVDEAAASLLQIADIDKMPEPKKLEAAVNLLNSGIENWLNCADRLAFCILKKYLREKDYRSEYTPYYTKLVNANPTYFQGESVYDNIITLCKRWKIELPAGTPDKPPSYGG